MHELLATIDDITYRRIIEDARRKGIDPKEWVRHAVNEFLTHPPAAFKEVPACENPPCSPAPVQVHAEMYVPHHGDECHVIIGQLQQRVRELETERDNLSAMLDQYREPGASVSAGQAEILTLNCEIEKNAYELDGMEAALERLRLEREELSGDTGNMERVRHLDVQIERRQYEVDNFRSEIKKLINTREILQKELQRQQKT